MTRLKIKLIAVGILLVAFFLALVVSTSSAMMQMITAAVGGSDESTAANGAGPTLVLETQNGSIESLLETGLAFLGTPYSFGFCRTDLTDCSGFTKQVFELAGTGITLPHSAQSQSGYGNVVYNPKLGDFMINGQIFFAAYDIYDTRVRTQLQPGDLIFFSFGRATENGAEIGHVAMYIGNGQCIHSLNESKGNFIFSIWDTTYSDEIVVVTRPIDSTEAITSDLTGNPLDEITKADAFALGQYLEETYPQLTQKLKYAKAIEIINLARTNQSGITKEVSLFMTVKSNYAPTIETQRIVIHALIGMWWEKATL